MSCVWILPCHYQAWKERDGNAAWQSGGSFQVVESNAKLSACTIVNNEAGAVRWHLDLSTLYFRPRLFFSLNFLLLKAGGAIFLRGDKDRFRSRAELKLCTLSRNSAQAVWQHLAVEASCLDML